MKTYYIFLFALLINNASLFGNTTTMPAEETACMCDPVSDKAALVTLYNSTDGANWTNTWDLGQPMSTWYGVTLNVGGCVEELNLDENQLNGNIPGELGNLSDLKELYLYRNELNGAIPSQLSNLTNLTHLILYRNELSGMIPSELGNLTNLTELVLFRNQLSGSIPSELGNLTNLTHLYLYRNLLSGTIPSELGNLTNLTHFYLYNNQLEGCFPQGFDIFCNILYDFTTNPNLSGGGDFDAFCSDGLGSCTSSCTLQDSLALVALYNSTNGANWTNTWDLAQPISTWYGVTLNTEGCVTELAVYNNQLNGTIPSELGNLASLTHLYLHQNQLSGNIPVELGNLSNLTYLFLYTNQLNGTIPSELGNLSNLIFLTLSENQLSGNIPAELGNLANLTHLFLNTNQLSGSIPAALGNLSNLTTLSLYRNQLSGTIPAELGNLANLTHLYLSENQLSGTIPVALGNLSNLTYLSLFQNQLSGTIPSELGNLTNLTHLYLDNNQLEGCFPQELDIFCNITYRFTNNPNLPGGGDFDAFCSGGLGSCTSSCTYQDSLTLVTLYNYTDGANWINAWDLAQPMSTWDGVTLSGEGCVTELVIYNNQLNGTIPSELGNLANLTYLHLGNNQLSGTIPSELGNLANLTHFSLYRNQLSGNIPEELGNLTNLERFHLDQNQLSGNIPVELGNLSNLTHLIFHTNQLSGTIPAELGNLLNLQKLYLYGNQLSGSIPGELGNLLNLWELSLSHNQLSGNIPVELANLSNLTHLNLGDNQLSGNIPVELANLSNLTVLRLQDNQLEGCFPQELDIFCNISYDFTNNPNLPNGGDFDAFCNNNTGACITGSDVWPGDVNNDGIVNANDIVLLGVKNDRIGIIRPNATTLWQAESCPDWNDTAPDGIDAKYADCNGDGTTDILSDGLAVQDNYGNTHPNGAFSISNSPTSSLVFRAVIRDETTNGNITTVTIDLELEETEGIANNFYGTAFVLDYAGLGETASIDGSTSFLGAEGTEMTSFAKDFAANRIEGAFTKINGSNNVIAAYETVILGSVLITRMNEIGTLDAGDLGFGSFYTVDNQLNEIELMTTTLPLSLLDFKANPSNHSIILNWTSANEKDMQSFDIERSENGIDFKKIGTQAALTNASFTKNYSHQDKNVQANITYYYRLKMIEIDNKFDYSNTIVASLKQENQTINNIQLLPNPTTGASWLIFENRQENPSFVEVRNTIGQLVQTYSFPAQEDRLLLDLKSTKKGLYFITITQMNEQQTLRWIKH